MIKLSNILKAIHRANKAEIEEIKNLEPTEQDNNEAEILASAAVATMLSFGIPTTDIGKRIIKRIFAVGIRNIKDGVDNNSKLLINRIIDEIKAEKA